MGVTVQEHASECSVLWRVPLVRPSGQLIGMSLPLLDLASTLFGRYRGGGGVLVPFAGLGPRSRLPLQPDTPGADAPECPASRPVDH